ncbi:transcription-repair coupling factor [Litorivicinus lipolyticus]|uniref:transcription-repair coupling factor n=1 Tax=Litorivicinus lipolyticus TaxID=418701 RepID=UPI003B5B6E0E
MKFPTPGDRQAWQVAEFAWAYALAEAWHQARGPILVVTPDSATAQRLEREVPFFAPDAPIITLPDWETLPYDSFSPHDDIVSARLGALAEMPNITEGLIFVPAQVLVQRLVPKHWLDGAAFAMRVGESLETESFKIRLERAGYRRVDTVYQHGEYAIRGNLLDLYPMGSPLPYRIDLFDDEIETLRAFDPETQRTVNQVDQIRLLPAREAALDEAGIRRFRMNWHDTFEDNPRDCPVYNDVSDGLPPSGVEYYLPLFFDGLSTLFDYLPAGTVSLSIGDIDASVDRFWKDIEARYNNLRHDRYRPLLEPSALYVRVEAIYQNLNQIGRLFVGPTPPGSCGVSKLPVKPLPDVALNPRAQTPMAALYQFVDGFDGQVLLVAESPGRRASLLERLDGNHKPTQVDDLAGVARAALNMTLGALDQGFIVDGLAIIPEAALLGTQVPQRRQRKKTAVNSDLQLRDLSELNEGDPVVHVEHGIGRYSGLQTLDVDNQTLEFVTLEYRGGSKLYVPVVDLDLLARYSGADVDSAPHDKLGSDRWSKARKKAAESVRDKAAELLDIYARRAARPGRAHELHELEYQRFADEFPFETTPDQQTAIDAVIGDLRAPHPMDRLVCGDVGFGKTEVALRAAFVAVQAGYQVGILVPTTLLAQQHFENFRDRFNEFPVNIELLSRFRSSKETTAVLEKSAAGQVDILVGTHKLLSRDMKFKNLGLLIIDEEHRFGVSQKEAMKSLRSEVDVLAMTATPIPRTLNMAMSGLRDLSIIATPPARRLSVKTFVKSFDLALVKEAMLRELLRGGQVYYLHNDVKTIERTAERLRELVPEARVVVGHGQMRERELEKVMSDFYHKRFNVLVCSTIIETGIDVPNANTILIDRADKFGLAQLHQLRGRVGRSHHQAYAYLLTPDPSALSGDAVKRLEAISMATELGAGFMLASHDLEIRGAGELLGDQQSGQMQTIGFSLYMEMLEEAVNAIREGREPALEKPLRSGVEVDIKVAALIPNDWLPDVPARLELYKRIAAAKSADALEDIRIEMVDRFGTLPDSVHNLLRQGHLRVRAKQLGLKRISAGEKGGKVEFAPNTQVQPMHLIKLVQTLPMRYRLDGADGLKVVQDCPTPESRFALLEDLFETLKPEYAA